MSQLTIEQALQIALQCHQTGKLREAEHLYGQILAVNKNHPDALHYLGVLAHQTGRNQLAVDLITRAIALKPGDSNAYTHLGVVLCAMGRLDESIAACRQAIDRNPDNPDPYYNLGNALKDHGQLNEALAAYRKAIELRPHWPEAHNNLITGLIDSRQLDQALLAARSAVALFPDSPDLLYTLGRVLHFQDKLDEAIAICHRVLTLNPNHADALSELGFLLQQKGEWENATIAYRRALQLNPNLPDAHFNLAAQLLLTGDFESGWKEYEWRWKMGPAAAWTPPDPQWDGSARAGRTILLHREQGFGDVLQFIRYVPLIAGRGGNIILVCPPELRPLLKQLPGVSQCLIPGQPLPHIDVQCPVMSLPLIFNTTLETIPRDVPYLHADPTRIEHWRRQLANDPNKLKVGLVWAGRPNHANDARRSISLAALAPLAQVPGISFYSLQIGEPASQAKAPPPGMNLIDRTAELTDFAETAAFIENLDLVISVDTAVVHLTGSLGKPVWTLLPFAPDWRWLLDRNDSPWYPTMRLFRQPTRGIGSVSFGRSPLPYALPPMHFRNGDRP
jgi:Flp pilus assembly protein TadD